MLASTKIRIIVHENNKKGDLFGRLVAELFSVLGYDQIQLNIHKSGREIDIQAVHRYEQRCMIAECKATHDKIGGDSINKFVGVLDVEQRKNKHKHYTGYYVSLSGFSETAIEQENDAGGNRIVMLDGCKVVDELIRGNIIVKPEVAIGRAIVCANNLNKDLKITPNYELLAHEKGWFWLFFFSLGSVPSYFSIIHADGEIISNELAEEITRDDKSVKGILHKLTYLSQDNSGLFSEEVVATVREKYYRYLLTECGDIQLEGLPSDQEIGSRRIKLEDIFVPLYLEELSANNLKSQNSNEVSPRNRVPVGDVLANTSHLAILAAPGGGKSTLLKRLAIAYAFPDRRKLISDGLPEREWLPIFIRCRQLEDSVKSPIHEIIKKMPIRAEIADELQDVFMSIVNRSLRNGNALLLIDGLDEITDDSSRLCFALQLCTFMNVYPAIGLIVTSREAGFRIIGGTLNSHCVHYKISDFDKNDIRRLTIAWYKEIIGNKPENLIDAEKLVNDICSSDRVLNLSKNPLLLTTLLLVKRWVGQLPTRRTVLYSKAIEVLLMTWNVEGHEPIDLDEAIPQLAFVAFSMMKEHIQRISLKKLKEALILARKQMPDILAYSKLSISQFIERVESRSSLLILNGYDYEDGVITPVYEFQHLTFQEYLSAVAIAQDYYPDRSKSDDVLSALKPYMNDESWKEVIPMAAVLAGRRAQIIIYHLVSECKKNNVIDISKKDSMTPLSILLQCLVDEVQIPPSLLRESLELVGRAKDIRRGLSITYLYDSKYGSELFNLAKELYMKSDPDILHFGGILSEIYIARLEWRNDEEHAVLHVENLLASNDAFDISLGLLCTMQIAFSKFSLRKYPKSIKPEAREISSINSNMINHVINYIYSSDKRIHAAACWALTWINEIIEIEKNSIPKLFSQLYKLWFESTIEDIKYLSAWALATLPLVERDRLLLEPNSVMIDFIKSQSENKNNSFKRLNACLVIGYYYEKPWPIDELIQMLKTDNDIDNNVKEKLLAKLVP